MKRFFRSTAVIIFAFVLLFSCSKEDLKLSQAAILTAYIPSQQAGLLHDEFIRIIQSNEFIRKQDALNSLSFG